MKVVMHHYLVVYLNVGINLEFTKKWSTTKDENSVVFLQDTKSRHDYSILKIML